MTEDALAIYQEFLDHMSDALIAGDAEAFLRHVFLPCRIVTENGAIDIPDRTMAERNFHGFANALRAQGVDAYVRTAKRAAFVAPDRIAGEHVARMLSGGKLVAPVFDNEMEIERRDGVWGMSEVFHRIRYVAWPDILPRAPEA